MNSKTIKLISTIMTIVMIVAMSTAVFADFKPNGLQANTNVNGTGDIWDLGKDLMGLIQIAGMVVAVIIIAVLGIKYLMGSTQEKAKYKEIMMPYLIGAILLFAAPTIANMVYEFAIGLGK